MSPINPVVAFRGSGAVRLPGDTLRTRPRDDADLTVMTPGHFLDSPPLGEPGSEGLAPIRFAVSIPRAAIPPAKPERRGRFGRHRVGRTRLIEHTRRVGHILRRPTVPNLSPVLPVANPARARRRTGPSFMKPLRHPATALSTRLRGQNHSRKHDHHRCGPGRRAVRRKRPIQR